MPARSPARVLMTTDTIGGVWHYALQLSSLLSATGVRVCLATMGREPTAHQRLDAAGIANLELHTSGFALEWMPEPWDDIDRAGKWLLSLAADFSPDVVHLNGFVHAALPWEQPVLLVAHSCVRSWWHAVHGSAPPREWDEYTRRVREGLSSADAIIVPSRAMRDALVECYGIGRTATVISNCRVAGERPIAHKEPVVFAAGRVWDPAKNIAMLDEVAESIDWPIFVAGSISSPDGSTPASLRRVGLLGPLASEAVVRWMDRAAIYALPARYEPFGLSVLEAALSGCALVLGDIASLRENWGDVARFVHPDRPPELRAALADLIEHSPTREALGRAARRRAADFAPAAHLGSYLAVYRQVVAADGRVANSAREL